MRVEWHGHAAFTLRGEEGTVFVEPFGEMSSVGGREIRWEYPPVAADGIDLLLVTHEHRDHNAVEGVGGEPVTLRAAPGRHETPIGEVLGIAAEHDEEGGSERGEDVIYVFELEGLRVAHFGDFGQAALRPEQAEELDDLDLMMIPVGGGPTIGGATAAAIVGQLRPAWAVPMHYRTPRIDFLDSEEGFTAELEPNVLRVNGPVVETTELERGEQPVAVVLTAP